MESVKLIDGTYYYPSGQSLNLPSAASDCYRWLVDGDIISIGDQYAPFYIAVGPNDPSVQWFDIEHRSIGKNYDSQKFRRLRRKIA